MSPKEDNRKVCPNHPEIVVVHTEAQCPLCAYRRCAHGLLRMLTPQLPPLPEGHKWAIHKDTGYLRVIGPDFGHCVLVDAESEEAESCRHGKLPEPIKIPTA